MDPVLSKLSVLEKMGYEVNKILSDLWIVKKDDLITVYITTDRGQYLVTDHYEITGIINNLDVDPETRNKLFSEVIKIADKYGVKFVKGQLMVRTDTEGLIGAILRFTRALYEIYLLITSTQPKVLLYV